MDQYREKYTIDEITLLETNMHKLSVYVNSVLDPNEKPSMEYQECWDMIKRMQQSLANIRAILPVK